MEIKSTLTNKSGQVLEIIYCERDPLKDLEGKILQGVHAFCFYKDKMVLVHHSKSGWTLPGAGIAR